MKRGREEGAREREREREKRKRRRRRRRKRKKSIRKERVSVRTCFAAVTNDLKILVAELNKAQLDSVSSSWYLRSTNKEIG